MHGREGLNHVHHLLSPFRPERPTRCTQYSISNHQTKSSSMFSSVHAANLIFIFMAAQHSELRYSLETDWLRAAVSNTNSLTVHDSSTRRITAHASSLLQKHARCSKLTTSNPLVKIIHEPQLHGQRSARLSFAALTRAPCASRWSPSHDRSRDCWRATCAPWPAALRSYAPRCTGTSSLRSVSCDW